MRRFCVFIAAAITAFAPVGLAQTGPYKVLKTAKVGGDGGFDYIYADVDARRLYIPRSGTRAPVEHGSALGLLYSGPAQPGWPLQRVWSLPGARLLAAV